VTKLFTGSLKRCLEDSHDLFGKRLMNNIVHLDHMFRIHPFPVIAGSENKNMYQVFAKNPFQTQHGINFDKDTA
jgi:hypothetical protein